MLLPMALWIWSSAPLDSRPENSLAVASWELPLDGKVTVMVSPAVNAMTPWEEKIVVRAVVEVTGISRSTV